MYRENGDHEGHGGMNHGMGMMLLGCVAPMAAIVLLPRVGVSGVAALAIGVGGMVLFHGGMMAVQRLRNRKSGNRTEPIQAHHHH
jgi:uncharacterized membrane protein HdeD (DUF308 family)